MLNTTRKTELSFHVLEEIGQEGKNSQVYLATDLQLDADIVVKKILKNKIASVDEYFLEASMLYLSSHPNVVPIYYACQDEEHIYLAMPYFEKGSLKSRLQNKYISVREIITYSTQILSGLHNIHSKRLIHFDVKLDNVLISERNEALLSDFGLTKQISYSGVVGQDRIYGTMTPPEAFRTNEFCQKFDIYQFGVTLHRMCVGDNSFYSEFNSFVENGSVNRARFQHAVVNGQFPNRGNYPEHIPQALINTIRGCLSVDLGERYSSAIDIVNHLSEIDGHLLDWYWTYNDTGSAWRKQLPDGRSYELLVNPDGSSNANRTSANNNTQRIRDYCKPNINRAEIKRFLRSF